MIKINVAEIKKQLIGSASYHYELDPEALDLTEDDVSLEGQVVADFTLHNGGELILLDGSLHFSVQGECGRCLKPLVQPLVSTLEERSYPEGTENLPDDAFTY